MSSLGSHGRSTDWRILTTPPLAGAPNMAVDVAMMEHARASGERLFRVYEWSRPTLSLGRNQVARGRYDLDRLRARDIDVVRRPTGGRAILHWHEITYSVAAPADEPLGTAYARINALLHGGLRRLGVPVTIAGSAVRETAPGLRPCFDHPSRGELVVEGRKLVGSAQWRDEGALLQHGSILVDDDQQLLAQFVSAQDPDFVTPPPPATLHALLGRIPFASELAGACLAAIAEQEGSVPVPMAVTDLSPWSSRWVQHFEDDGWTWRR